MRKIILNLPITLDGLIEVPNAEMDWLVRDEEKLFGDILNKVLGEKYGIFYGRVSYNKWRNSQSDESANQKIKEAYKLMNSSSATSKKPKRFRKAIRIGKQLKS